MTRISLWIDDANISANCGHNRVNWKAFLNLARLQGDVQIARIYDAINPTIGQGDQHQGFIQAMQRMGLTYVPVPYKTHNNGNVTTVKGNCDVQLATDMILTKDSYDVAILVSGDGDYVPVLKALKGLGKRTLVTAFTHIAAELKEEADLFLNAWLLPGVFSDNRLLHGLCHEIFDVKKFDNAGFLRYLKPDWQGNLFEMDTRLPNSAWAQVAFEKISDQLIKRLPSPDVVLEFEIGNYDVGAKNVHAVEDL